MTDWPRIRLCESRRSYWRAKYTYRRKERIDYQRKVENNKRHFPNHHDALRKAEAGVAKWGKLEGEAAQEIHRYDAAIAKLRPKPPSPHIEGLSTPATSWNPYRRPIANWMIPVLQWAHDHGWTGIVVSGYRSRAAQWIAAVKYGLWHYPGGNPFLSNHLKWIYPGGAVDVTNYEQLAHVLRGYSGPRKLLWAGPTIGDVVHFSANAH
jgi:hypothetical protein